MYIAVISCDKNLDTRIPIQSKYSLSSVDYTIINGSGSRHKYNNQKVLQVGDGYEDLKYKTLALIKIFLQDTDKEHLIKLDDDTFVDTTNLQHLMGDYVGIGSEYFTFLHNIEQHIQYIRNKSGCIDTQNVNYFNYDDFKYAEGGCYCLSRRACTEIYNASLNQKNLPFFQEDITIGYLAKLAGIPLKNTGRHLPWYDISNDNVSFHPSSLLHFKKLREVDSIEDRINICNELLPFNPYYREYHDLKRKQADK